jgi:hypothetical protein
VGAVAGTGTIRTAWSRTGRRVAAGAAALLLLGVVGACSTEQGGSASSSSDAAPAAPAEPGYAPEAAYGAPDAARSAGGSGVGGSGAGGAEVGGPGAGGAAPSVPLGAVDRALVRTAQVSLEVADTGAALDGVRAAAAAAGGFVAEERSGGTSGHVVLRVPAAALDALVEQVVALAEPGTPVERSAAVVDATEEVVDLDARVASQRASVERVRGLLTGASTIGDVIAVESELAQREAELDSLTARLAALRDQVALSTLTVSLDGPDDPVIAAADAPPGFLDGLAAGVEGVLALGRGAGALLGFVLPFVPVLAVVAAAVFGVVRLVRGRRAAPQGSPG